MPTWFCSFLICACMLLPGGVKASNTNYDDMIQTVSSLYEDLLQQDIESEVPGFLRRHDEWIAAHVEKCGFYPEIESCLEDVQGQIRYLSRLKAMLAGLRSLSYLWGELQTESSPKLPASAVKDHEDWTKKTKVICADTTLYKCESALNQRRDLVLTELLEQRYVVEHKKLLEFYEAHFLQVLESLKAVTPFDQWNRFATEMSKRKMRALQSCSVMGGATKPSTMTGLPANRSDVFRCQWQRLGVLGLELETTVLVRHHPVSTVPLGRFSWLDGVGVMVEDPSEPVFYQGEVSLNPLDDGVGIDFYYVGINGHTCGFSAVFKEDRREKKSYGHVFDSVHEGEKCQLNVRFSQNYMYFNGVAPQSACSTALSCGHRAYLPDVVPLMFSKRTIEGLGRSERQ